MTSARVRMSPESRREQLLDLGVRLLSTRSLDALSIELLAEEAGISRGLLYHYFGNKQEFHRAVVRRAADDLYRITRPDAEGDPLSLLRSGVAAYVDYVATNHEGYVSLVRAAAGGDPALREIYEESRTALTDRIFETADAADLAAVGIVEDALTRQLVRGWSALVEETVLGWVADPGGVGREDLIDALTRALPAVVAR